MISSSTYHSKIKIKAELVAKLNREASSILKSATLYDHHLVNGRVNSIALISPGGRPDYHQGYSNGPEFIPTVHLKKCPLIENFIQSIPGKKYSCRLLILENETEMHPHRDPFRSLEFGVIRLHLPLQTDSKILFHLAGKEFHLEKNYLHFVDISQIHFVKNPTYKKRIHLVVDVEVNDKLLTLFKLPDLLVSKKAVKSFPLQPLSVKMPEQCLPYPLNQSKKNWKIKNEEEQWYLCSEKLKFKISESNTGRYFLESVGPGFTFVLGKNFIQIECAGVTVYTGAGVAKITNSAKIKLNKELKKGLVKYQRSLDFLEMLLPDKTLLLVNKADYAKFYLLDEEAKKIWKSLLMPRPLAQTSLIRELVHNGLVKKRLRF